MRRTLFAGCLLSLAAAPAVRPAGAAEVEKYLPEDAEVVATVNIKQLLESELVKKHALEMIKDAIKNNTGAQKQLSDLGLNPLTDFERVTLAGTAGGTNKMLIV